MRLRDRTRRDRDREEHRLGGDEFLPLRTTRAADPDRGAGKSINRQNVSRRTRRPEGRRDLELRSTDTVSSGADSRISELSQRPGLQPNALIQLPPDFSEKFVIPERELLQGLQTANQIKRNRAGEVPPRQLDFRDGAIRSARDSGEGAERRIGVPRVERVGNGALEGGFDGQESFKLVGEGNGEEEEEEEEKGGEDWPENHGGRHC
nr:hypothetical protein Itr_chr09CG04790 [Ipomoea trifida]